MLFNSECPLSEVQLYIHAGTCAALLRTYYVHGSSMFMLIPQGSPGVVSCQEGQLHGLETGDQVEFREVVGMEELNGKTVTVKGMNAIHV